MMWLLLVVFATAETDRIYTRAFVEKGSCELAAKLINQRIPEGRRRHAGADCIPTYLEAKH